MIREGCDPNSRNVAFGTSRPSDVLGTTTLMDVLTHLGNLHLIPLEFQIANQAHPNPKAPTARGRCPSTQMLYSFNSDMADATSPAPGSNLIQINVSTPVADALRKATRGKVNITITETTARARTLDADLDSPAALDDFIAEADPNMHPPILPVVKTFAPPEPSALLKAFLNGPITHKTLENTLTLSSLTPWDHSGRPVPGQSDKKGLSEYLTYINGNRKTEEFQAYGTQVATHHMEHASARDTYLKEMAEFSAATAKYQSNLFIKPPPRSWRLKILEQVPATFRATHMSIIMTNIDANSKTLPTPAVSLSWAPGNLLQALADIITQDNEAVITIASMFGIPNGPRLQNRINRHLRSKWADALEEVTGIRLRAAALHDTLIKPYNEFNHTIATDINVLINPINSLKALAIDSGVPGHWNLQHILDTSQDVLDRIEVLGKSKLFNETAFKNNLIGGSGPLNSPLATSTGADPNFLRIITQARRDISQHGSTNIPLTEIMAAMTDEANRQDSLALTQQTPTSSRSAWDDDDAPTAFATTTWADDAPVDGLWPSPPKPPPTPPQPAPTTTDIAAAITTSTPRMVNGILASEHVCFQQHFTFDHKCPSPQCAFSHTPGAADAPNITPAKSDALKAITARWRNETKLDHKAIKTWNIPWSSLSKALQKANPELDPHPTQPKPPRRRRQLRTQEPAQGFR